MHGLIVFHCFSLICGSEIREILILSHEIWKMSNIQLCLSPGHQDLSPVFTGIPGFVALKSVEG